MLTFRPLRLLADARGLAAMRHRNYRLYWTGQLVSLVGTHMQRAAQAWLVLTLTNDPLMLGFLVSAQFGPILVFGLFGGIIADSLPKRQTILVTQTIAMVLAFTLAALAATGTAQVWHVIVLALLLGIATVVDLPARQTFVMEMVGREDVVSAVALNSAIVNGAKVAGPAIAGITIAAVGTAVAFFLNGISFLAVIGGLLAMRADELTAVAPTGLPRSVRGVVENLTEGLRYVLRTRHVLLALAIVGLVSTAGMNLQVLIPPLARDVLGTGASGYGFLMAAAGAGSITAALVFAFRGRPRLPGILAAALVLGVFEVILGTSRAVPVSLACMALVGFGGVAMSVSANTSIQTSVPDQLRGRVMALYITLFAGSTPVGGLIAGGIAGAFGPPAALIVGGGVSAAVAVGLGLVAWRWGLLRPGFMPPAVASPTSDEADELVA